MAEPEDVIAEGALVATRVVRELWTRRDRASAAGARVALRMYDGAWGCSFLLSSPALPRSV